ncbi:GNAT family N-acetyltransferase [Chelatococcus sp. GCM10030263]|uniref:GNAT family N-acetyltransferase n=1 Tax=Chelatococcus sp. GCM10030263 TaxID=3273387 RepID=UPI003617AA9D
MTLIIRRADERDMADIASFYDVSWRETYLGLMDDGELRGLHQARAECDWLETSARDGALLIAERDGALIGFGACGPARDAALGAAGEVYAIYVAQRLRYRGIGTALMGRMARGLARRGISDIGLWVFHRNVAAVVFARALGAGVGGIRSGDTPTRATELALVWPQAEDLALFDDEEHDRGSRRARHDSGLERFGPHPCLTSCK